MTMKQQTLRPATRHQPGLYPVAAPPENRRIQAGLGRRFKVVKLGLRLDSKLRACDLVKLRGKDICHGDRVATRAIVLEQKASPPGLVDITQPTREAVDARIKESSLKLDDYWFSSRDHESPHLGTRQYARSVDGWIMQIGLDPTQHGTHSMRCTKATLIYRRTKNLRAMQLLLGHTNMESTVRFLGIEIEDALERPQQTDV